MACPMRFVLAALSACVAFFIIWRRKDEHDAEGRPTTATLLDPDNKGWLKTTLSFFTGRFLWEVYTRRAHVGSALKAD